MFMYMFALAQDAILAPNLKATERDKMRLSLQTSSSILRRVSFPFSELTASISRRDPGGDAQIRPIFGNVRRFIPGVPLRILAHDRQKEWPAEKALEPGLERLIRRRIKPFTVGVRELTHEGAYRRVRKRGSQEGILAQFCVDLTEESFSLCTVIHRVCILVGWDICTCRMPLEVMIVRIHECEHRPDPLVPASTIHRDLAAVMPQHDVQVCQ